jgi:5'-nucleotidase
LSLPPRWRRLVAGLAAFGVALSGLAVVSASAPAQANPAGTGLVISEVYGGGGNSGAPYTNDFIELYNPTDAPISVAGWSVQGRSATNTSTATTGANITALTGSVPAGGYYLIQEAAGSTPSTSLPSPDATGTMGIAGGGWQIWLANTTTPLDPVDGDVTAGTPDPAIIDFVGAATNSASFEKVTANEAPSNTLSAQRNGSNADTDHNANDFSTAAPTPTNSVVVGGPLTAASQTNVRVYVGTEIAPINLAATGGTTPYLWDVNGLPPGLSATPAGVISGSPTTEGSYPVTATVTDSATPAASDEVSFTITVRPAVYTAPIAEIQGTGDASELVGDTVTTEGVVTAKYPGGTGTYNGIYIQTAGSGGTTNDTAGASDAIFVFGNNSQPDGVEIGDSVQVTGVVSEFNGLTELTPGSGGVVEIASLGAVTPRDTIPGTDCALPGTDCLTGAALSSAREAFEGELFQPTGDYTVTDVHDGSAYNGSSFSSSFFGEVGLAAESDMPLVTPIEVIDAQATADVAARKAYNNAHRMVLDDGAGVTYWNTAGTGAMDQPIPWFTESNQVRVGAGVTFPKPVVMEWRNNTWKLQPQTRVTDSGSDRVAFEQTRPAQPEDVGGDLKLGTFNVLNYFTTLGADYGGCTAFNDREGNPIAVNQCPGTGPRGAWNQASFDRQQTKIVNAINTLDADIVALEEIENSGIVDGGDRDEAVETLVAALNADAGSTRWAFVDSPSAVDPGEDVIRTAMIYSPDTVDLVGDSELFYDTAFNNAREPFAQTFKAEGAEDTDGFAVIANHFKSKGSGADDGTGQGLANPDRIAQANALVGFADDFAVANGVEKVFLTGDFNANSMEDPVQVLTAAGYTSLESTDDPHEETYNFDGQIQSLDHVFANEAAEPDVTGVDVWTINSYESQYYEYSRFNYNVRQLYDPAPFRASDHNPEIVGIDVPAVEPATRDIQILGTNDFHGRLENNPSGTEAGAAVLAGAVKQLRQQNPDTVFAAAGDLIGASTFTSFIQNDKPTIDALNEAGLEVSAVGNHELDQGYDDLVDRVMAAYDPNTNPEGGAEWQYIAANLKIKATGDPAVPATWVKSFGKVDVGFVGAVTEDLPALVNPDGIAELEVGNIVESVNAAAGDLEANGADVIVMLVHEGAPGTNCATMDDSGTWADIINNVDSNVDAIVSGHTHLAYNCSFPVAGWAGRPVTERPVVSAGQYGTALNQLVFTVDTATGEVTAKSQALLNLKTGQTPNYPSDPATAQIVADAVAAAGPLGSVELGKIDAPLSRAKFGDGTRENRGGESTLGNLVAEVQRWATEAPESGGAQIAFMNPGGLRADMLGLAGEFPRTLTYRQAADVQPFANTLVNMDLTGANIKLVLEQQWQRNIQGQVPSRPFLKLGVSEGFEYTYDPALPEGSRITSMTLNGEPIDLGATYSVTVNSFLAAGGDNFKAFGNGTGKQDTGKVDLQAMVDYMDEFANTGAGDDPLPVDYGQRAVGASFPQDDTSFLAGSTAELDLSSLIMTGSVGSSPDVITDEKDAEVAVRLDGVELGTFPVDATIPNPGTGQQDGASSDEAGKTDVSVEIPVDTEPGEYDLVVTGETTGTEAEIPITVEEPEVVDTTVAATGGPVVFGTDWNAAVTVTPSTATGQVEVLDGTTSLGTATLSNGAASVAINGTALQPGTHTLRVNYAGDATHAASTGSFQVQVAKAVSTTTVDVDPSEAVVRQDEVTLTATVSAAGVDPSGTVVFSANGVEIGQATLSDGKATLTGGPISTVGTFEITATYQGDATTAPSTSAPAQLEVVKADVLLRAEVKPNPVIVDRTKTHVEIEVTAPGQRVTGKVEVSWKDETRTVTLEDGRATVQLGKWHSTGEKTVRVHYLGSNLANPETKVVTFRVRPKPGR